MHTVQQSGYNHAVYAPYEHCASCWTNVSLSNLYQVHLANSHPSLVARSTLRIDRPHQEPTVCHSPFAIRHWLRVSGRLPSDTSRSPFAVRDRKSVV